MDDRVIGALAQSISDCRARGGDLAGEIAESLREEIVSGRLAPGDKLANEIALARRLSVSRATWREAVRMLLSDRLLVARRGSGTYVTDNPVAPIRTGLDRIVSMTETVRAAGGRAGSRALSCALVPADEAVAGALLLDPGAEVVRVCRTRVVGDTPFSLAVEHVAVAGPDEAEAMLRFGGGSIFDWVGTELGRQVSHSETSIRAEIARAEVAARLEVASGTPLLRLTEIISDADGMPIMHADNLVNTAIVDFSLHRRVTP